MKTKNLSRPKVNIITLGCSKNLVDSENLSGQLVANDFEVEHESTKDREVVIVNTCGFIDKAKEESINTILDQIERKKDQLIDKLYVTGCLSERYREQLREEMPEVDDFFGTMELPRILKVLEADYKTELIGERLLSTPQHYAYLKISEGCNRTCAFCAIPLMRGKHISKPIDELLIEAQKLASMGVKELILIAQELTYYGLDIYKKRMLPQLLEKLSEIEGIEWIRLHYAYPTKFPRELLPVMRENPKVCNYLDIPLQHASDSMLTSMRRQITKSEMLDLIEEIRAQAPETAIRTSMIVGYPGETEEDFEELLQFLTDVEFERVGVFTYSHEENTTAHELVDDVPQEVKEERAQRLIQHQMEISMEKNEAMIGKEYKVLIDRKEAGRYIGRTEYDSVEVDNEVIVHSAAPLVIGSFYKVRIDTAYEYDLEGEAIF